MQPNPWNGTDGTSLYRKNRTEQYRQPNCNFRFSIYSSLYNSLCKEKNISNTEFAVASSFELPFSELTADLIVSTFAPVSNDEYARVLKKGRYLVIVSPAPKHLFGLKQVLYETPYENKPNSYGLKKFALEKQYTVDFNIQLDSNDDIMNLFKMTPYYYKTSESSVSKLKNLQKLDTPCEFFIDIYRKK